MFHIVSVIRRKSTMISKSEMKENYFRSMMIDHREKLDRDGNFVLAQERGYLESRARDYECGWQWACVVPTSAPQSCVMATDQESNNLDEFDLEQVINWEEHNYASKNLEIQELPDLDLPADLPVSAGSALPGSSTTVSHGRQLLLGNQVIGSHTQPTREQNASIMAGMPQASTSSVLNPVFPQSASCMIADIRDELGHARVPSSSRHVEPAFPSENFDLPSINHQSPLVSSRSQPLNYLAGHRSQVGGMQVPPAQPLGHTGHAIQSHRPLRNGMQSFNQPNLTSTMPNLPVNEPLNPSMENDDGGDSIDQLIEDIVDRDMPQGLGDAVVFSSTSHGVPLSNQHQHQHQHQPMHHVMAQNPRSSSPSQMAAMVRSPSSGPNGSPLAGSSNQIPSAKPLGTSIPHANSPLSQNPASPIKAPSPQMPQYKASVPLRGSRGSKSVKLPNQQQPHSPQSMTIGVNQGQGQVHSPRPTPQRSPQQSGSAQSPPSVASSIMSQNISSPLAQMSPLASGTPQNIMGNMNVQQSPVASPMNISSPQSQRPPRQASPGLCNISSPVPPVTAQEFPKHQAGASLTQPYMTQANAAKAAVPKQSSLQNGNSLRQATITQPNVVRTQGSVLQQQVSSVNTQDASRGNNIWSQNPFLSNQQLQRPVSNATTPAAVNVSTQRQSEQPPQEQATVDISSSRPISQQASTSVPLSSMSQTQLTSTFDTATVLRGLTALKGSNVLPLSIKQGGNNQQLQAVKLPNTAANIDLLKKAMLLKQGGAGQSPGKPMAINTPQGQVLCYIIPKGTSIGTGSGSSTQNTSGQPVKMVLINTNSSTANTAVKTVNSTVDGMAKPSAQVFSLNNNTSATSSSTVANAGIAHPVTSSLSSSSSNPIQQGQNPLLHTPLVAKFQGISTVPTLNQPSIISTSSQQQHSTLDANLVNQLVSGQGTSNITVPSNSSSAQNISTTQITFVNECTAVNHLVSATGVGQLTSNIFTTHPVTLPAATTVSKAAPVSSTAQPSVTTVAGDSDDSDTPLAVVAESLRKAGGDEKKKKKKKKGEKRKKKDKTSAGSTEKVSPAFQIFFKETQAAIRQQNPSAQFNDVTKIVRQMWENLPEEQKKVYYAKYEKVKAEKSDSKPQEPSPKIRKLDNSSSSTASPISSPKTTGQPSSSSVTISTNKEPNKQESITLKIPKSVLSKSEPPVKIAKVTSTTVGKTITAGSASSPPVKTKKPKMSINPISQRICIREGCNMPARTTKERGTQYCSNDCIIAHCRHVFNSWVSQRKQEVPVT